MKNLNVLKGKINFADSRKVSLRVNLASSNKSSTTKFIVFLSIDAIFKSLLVINGLWSTSLANAQLKKCFPNLLLRAFSYLLKLLFKSVPYKDVNVYLANKYPSSIP